eukprot:UN23131
MCVNYCQKNDDKYSKEFDFDSGSSRKHRGKRSSSMEPVPRPPGPRPPVRKNKRSVSEAPAMPMKSSRRKYGRSGSEPKQGGPPISGSATFGIGKSKKKKKRSGRSSSNTRSDDRQGKIIKHPRDSDSGNSSKSSRDSSSSSRRDKEHRSSSQNRFPDHRSDRRGHRSATAETGRSSRHRGKRRSNSSAPASSDHSEVFKDYKAPALNPPNENAGGIDSDKPKKKQMVTEYQKQLYK